MSENPRPDLREAAQALAAARECVADGDPTGAVVNARRLEPLLGEVEAYEGAAPEWAALRESIQTVETAAADDYDDFGALVDALDSALDEVETAYENLVELVTAADRESTSQ